MGFYYFFLQLVTFLTPFVLIYLFLENRRLKAAHRALRGEVRAIQKREAARDATQPAAEAPAKATSPAPQADHAAPAQEQPAAVAQAETVASPADSSPPKTFVFGQANIRRLTGWLKENWVYAVAALSLAMAGIFLVQYSIENGLLSPQNRVLCALAFGGALIAGGEWIRRRGGDGAEDLTAFLPSTFAGAGVVTLFSAVISAQQLYGLIGAEVAFAGLVAVAALSIVLGWVYGPFLTAIGILGAVIVPFAVSTGQTEHVAWLFYYFALISAAGLCVDAMKRSAWISAIAIAAPYAGATLIWMAKPSEGPHFLAFASIVAILTTCIPTLSKRPVFEGAMTFHKLHSLGASGWPEFPTRLAAAGLLALCAVAVLTPLQEATIFWLALGVLFIALYVLAFWLDRSPVLDDIAIPVLGSMLAIIWLQGFFDLEIAHAFRTAVVDMNHGMPMTITAVIGFGLIVSALLGWKSLNDRFFPLGWTIAAAVFAPSVVMLLGLFWQPMSQLSEPLWALHVMAVAALMTGLAERTLRAETDGRLRTAVFALSALNMIALAMSIILTETALTLGIAALAVSGAWLDKKFDVKPVTWFVQISIIACGYRLVADPGLLWAIKASLGELWIGYVGTILLLAVAWWLLKARNRTSAIIVAESACASLIGIFISVLLFRALEQVADVEPHWALSLFAMVWLISAASQLYRTQISGWMQTVRYALAGVFGVLGLLPLLGSLTFVNPLYNNDEVQGPPIVDSLLVAYLLPALLLGAVAWYFKHLPKWLRISIGVLAGICASMYIGLEIRRLWQGTDLTRPVVLDGELYSYTIVMLLIGSALLLLALLRRSALLQRMSIGVIALTIAKVFLIDMSGLEGLMRALSFLALGLVLAGLAMLNRWLTRTLKAEA